MARVVDIVVPAYNAVETLSLALRSALKQFEPVSITVIDDGSNDDTLSVARGFEPSVRVLTGTNKGVSAARNRGISETSGEWLLFLDADDELLSGTLEARLSTPGAAQADVIICDWEDAVEDGAGDLRPIARRSVDWDALAKDAEIATAGGVWAPTAAILYRRTIIDRIGGFRNDLPIIQDARFLFDAVYAGAKILRAPHIGARYRIHPHSLSRRSPGRFFADILTNGQQIEGLWRERGDLSPSQHAAVAGMYNTAARGLFAAGEPLYFRAVAAQRSFHTPPLHTRIAAPLARRLGLGNARRLFSWVGRV